MIKISEQNQIKIGVFISYFSLFASAAISIFYSPFLLNAFGDETFGIFSFSQSLVSWLSVFSFGFTSTYIYFATRAEKKDQQSLHELNLFYVLLFFGLTCLALLAGFVVLLLLRFEIIPLGLYTDSQKSMILLLTALSAFHTIIYLPFDIFKLFPSYKSKFIWVRAGTLVINVLTPLLVVLFIQINSQIWIVPLVQICVQILIGIANFCYSVFVLKFKVKRIKAKRFKKLIRTTGYFSLFIFINTIVDQINANVDKTLLGLMVGAGSVTLYAFGMQFSTYVTTMASAITDSLAPRFNRYEVSKDVKSTNELFLNATHVLSFLVLYIFGGFLSCGDDFIQVWLGKERFYAFWVGLILIGFQTLPLAEAPAIEVQRARNMHKFRSVFLLIATLANVILTIIFLFIFPTDFKILGCLVSTGISTICSQWIALNIYYEKRLGLPVKTVLLRFLKLAFFSISSSVATRSLFLFTNYNENPSWLSVFVKALAFSLFFALFVLLFDRNEFLKDIHRLFRRKSNGKE